MKAYQYPVNVLSRTGIEVRSMLGIRAEGVYITENNQFTIISIMRPTKKIQLLIDYLEGVKTGYFKNAFSGGRIGVLSHLAIIFEDILSFIIDFKPKFIMKIPSNKLENAPCFA